MVESAFGCKCETTNCEAWARIHKNLSALTSQVHTQHLRSCFNLSFQIEEFVGVLRCKIYILNEKAINLSINKNSYTDLRCKCAKTFMNMGPGLNTLLFHYMIIVDYPA